MVILFGGWSSTHKSSDQLIEAPALEDVADRARDRHLDRLTGGYSTS
jgi:hypothetical protein